MTSIPSTARFPQNDDHHNKGLLDGRMARFSLLAMGVVGTLTVYGILQERIMTIPYGAENFTLSLFLVFINRLFGVLFSVPMIGVQGETVKNKAPLWKYIMVSLASVLASTCQYEALKYVSFPVQILGKSFKMMPVMLWGILISRKSYGSTDWLIAFAVTAGTTLFACAGSIQAPTTHSNTVYGLTLLAVFLICDGLTSTMQEKLFKDYSTTQFNQMLYVNLGSGIVAGTALELGMRGGISKGFTFAMQHSEFRMDALGLSITAVSSQWFILSQVRDFGALIFAATINCRQVVSILVSCLVYDHAVTVLQWQGLSIVFTALLYKSYRVFQTDEKHGESSSLVEKSGAQIRRPSHIEQP